MAALPISIREVEEQDLSSVLDLEYKCFPDPYPLTLLHRLHSMHRETFLVAESNGRVVGYVIGAIRWRNTGHVLAIGVEPGARRQGIGAALMEEVMRKFQLKGVRLVRLEVRKSNLQAQNFYRKLGFIERFEVPFYYEDGESAITMERNL
jgi:ribosomal-protein-alanine N-acetyltransferase